MSMRLILPLFILAIGTFFTSNSFASTIQCGNGGFGAGPNHSLIFDYFTANCEDEEGESYTLKIRGAGPAIGAALVTGMFVECPGAKNIEGTYYGVKASAAIVVGLRLGIFAASNGRVCFVGAGDLSALQVGVTINKIEIERRY